MEILPAELGLSHWRNIEVFSICRNNLTSFPFDIGTLKTLVTLKCESNALQELPESIAHLENLEELVLSHNELTFLPRTIGMLHRLRFLFVDNNCLQQLPDELCDCQQLSILSVSRNLLRELPQNIGNLAKLKVLNIVKNRISCLPMSTLNLKSLTSLWISDNQSKPLVPLQYIDGDFRSQLTCFMLPQVPYNSQQQQSIPATDNNCYQSNMENNQVVTDPTTTTTAVTLSAMQSPNRRIYFAEETTIYHENNEQNANQQADNVEYYRATNELSQLRSPPPYPKELCAMAKSVRNGQLAAEKAATFRKQQPQQFQQFAENNVSIQQPQIQNSNEQEESGNKPQYFKGQQPPPYHLACAFSKKTAEDMCQYERTRQQRQQQQQKLEQIHKQLKAKFIAKNINQREEDEE